MKVKVFWNIFKLKVVRNSNKHNESINKHHHHHHHHHRRHRRRHH
jgi:hypothetical protein